MQTGKSVFNWTGKGGMEQCDWLRPGRVKAPAVLVVEDDEDIAELLRYSLAKKGVTVVLAHDGMAGFDLAEEVRPCLILLDIMLPNLNGHEVCSLIRAHPDRKLAQTPIIMLSALTDHDDIARGMFLGADGYFTKPYEVKEVVREALKFLCPDRREAGEGAEGFW